MGINEFAKRAPMGWNSYDYYDTTVTEEEIKANARYMAENLKDFGYDYVVIDIEWYSNDAGSRRHEYQYIPFGDDELDGYGRLQPSPKRFPSSADGSGFKSLADYVHSLGLKFGIHIMRGISRQAAHNRCPIHGSSFTCDQAADAWSICGWNPDMYGVRNNEAGQAYYDDLIAMYAEWGVDFIKCDDICDSFMYPDGHRIVFSGYEETKMIHRAIEKSGREIVLSLSPGPAHVDRDFFYEENANMWRITDDFWDDWRLLKEMFWRCETWNGRVSKGNYPDCDMLPLGHLGHGFGNERISNFSDDEIRTMMSLWCLFGSPLMIGAELTKLTDKELSFLTNKDLLAVMDGDHRGLQVYRDDEKAIWVNTDEKGTECFVGLFNLTDEEREIECSKDSIGVKAYNMPSATEMIKDVWNGTESEGNIPEVIKATVPAHGTVVYRFY
ncbi:MAG: glycoside hydrolase family 27 protein [Butyrivibrio sp.]|nr:glycoside hydrolase family 27 protein [Butyrivibrio sp.]